MKFVELKKSLNKLNNIYLINGEDRFLCHNALEQILSACGLSMPEMNYVNMENVSVDDIIASANIYPFIDERRVVVVKDFVPKSGSDNSLKKLEEYFKNPMPSTILIFFNIGEDNSFKSLQSQICVVDCSKLDGDAINSYICKSLDKYSIRYTKPAVNLLALYCSYDMQRISAEVDKLISYSAGQIEIDEQVIRDLVVQDKEYQIYELAELICKNNAEKALDLIDTLGRKNGFSILSPLYNNYRRALYVAITNSPDSVLAKNLGIKEFAVKMLKNQLKVFSPKKLKLIVDMMAKTDSDIKTGKMKEDIAVKTVVLQILKIRNS